MSSKADAPIQKISSLRYEYAHSVLIEAHADQDPYVQFDLWFADAERAQIREPNAMILATTSSNGSPSVRTVLLKGRTNKGFVFYTNYRSLKGKEISDNNRVAALFLWKEVERQVRIVGEVSQVSRVQNEEYFASRPRGSQLAAWASPQSETLSSRQHLEELYAEAERKFEGKEIPCPDWWGGYELIPDRFEFWQGRESRLHDRLAYVLKDGGWSLHRLSP